MVSLSKVLEVMVEQISDAAQAVQENRKVAERLERAYRTRVRIMGDQISLEFGRFVEGVNAGLPEDQRVTRWHVSYDPKNKVSCITILDIGGEPYHVNSFTERFPLPSYLSSRLEQFGRELPGPIHFDLQNHTYSTVF